MRSVENIVARVEQFINPIDWVPVAASFSGMVRILAGAVQMAAGIAFGILKACFSTRTRQMKKALTQGYLYALHGAGNMLRGSIAMLPGINTILFVHDKYLGRMNYPQEKMRAGVYPLTTAYRLAH